MNSKAALAIITILAPAFVSGCIPKPDAERVSTNIKSVETVPCNSALVQKYIGKRFTAVLAEQMRKESGAIQLRTGPKDGPVTMDYIAGRLNIFHDDEMLIAIVNCG